MPMKIRFLVILICALLLAPAPAGAADAAQAEALAKKYNCLQCHAIDKKIIGPTYRDVAKKYQGAKDAQALLVKSVKAGSMNKWGQIPMPPNEKVSDAEAATLVRWVLTQ